MRVLAALLLTCAAASAQTLVDSHASGDIGYGIHLVAEGNDTYPNVSTGQESLSFVFDMRAKALTLRADLLPLLSAVADDYASDDWALLKVWNLVVAPPAASLAPVPVAAAEDDDASALDRLDDQDFDIATAVRAAITKAKAEQTQRSTLP